MKSQYQAAALAAVCVIAFAALFIGNMPETAYIQSARAVGEQSPVTLSVNVDAETGYYQVFVGRGIERRVVLEAAEIAGLQSGGKWYSANDNMALTGVSQYTGEDAIGEYSAYVMNWQLDDGTPFRTHILQYKSNQTLVFRQEFPNGVKKTNVPRDTDGIASSFPNFKLYAKDEVAPEDNLGFYGYYGTMIWYGWQGLWVDGEVIPGGANGGLPLFLFSPDDFALVVSPLNNFFTASSVPYYSSAFNASVGLGVLGSVTEIDAHATFDFVLHVGGGVNEAVDAWGRLLRAYYDKPDCYRKSDFANNYLGYWTDFGACYYYNLDGHRDYEQVLREVIAEANALDIPFRYVQLDSWWYYKQDPQTRPRGILNWTAMTDGVFPRNTSGLQAQLQMPLASHSRYFSHKTNYAAEFPFHADGENSLPMSQDFWNFLMCSSAQDWHLILYEQDWIDFQFDQIRLLQTNMTAGRTWLRQMGNGAEYCNINIQYCMTYPRHAMQSIEVPRVTQIRASDDYLDRFKDSNMTKQQWKIGRTSMLAWALGLSPFKDSIHTTVEQPGCAFNPELYPELEIVIATLSTGVVGPGDLIGHANKTLIMQSCMPDGRILKPGVPIMSIDDEFYQRNFGGPLQNYSNVWRAYTTHAKHKYYNLLANNVSQNYNLYPKSLYPQPTAKQLIAVDWHTRQLYELSATTPLVVRKNRIGDFHLYAISPVLTAQDGAAGFVLLGELDKITPMSEQRFGNIEAGDNAVHLYLNGVVSEQVTVAALLTPSTTAQIQYFTCTIGQSGTVVLTIPSGECTYP